MAKASKLPGNLNLGGEAAETDSLLQDAFFESGIYQQVSSREDAKCFLVGRTGSGKSAALRRLEEKFPEHVIRITPGDLSLTYISNLGVIQYLSSLNVHLDPLFDALWKHVFLVEIIRKRYSVDSEDVKTNIFAQLRQKISRNRGKEAALDYLEEFEGKFWCETDERVKDFTRKVEQSFKNEGGLEVGKGLTKVRLSGSDGQNSTVEEHAELVQRYQRIVNDTQAPRLNKMITVLDDDILDTPHNYFYVVIDDLDEDWVDEQTANDLIRCLFRTILALKKVQNLKIIVALRTNIFEQLDFGSKTGGQEEKFRALTMRMRWNKNDIKQLLTERARVVAQLRGIEGVNDITDLLPRTNKARGNAFDFILQRTLMRPRDAIVYFNECLQLANGKSYITWDIIHDAEPSYSRNRLLALRDEWKPSFPGIDRVFRIFSRTPSSMTPYEFCKRLDDAILLTADPSFPGTVWMTRLSEAVWSDIGLKEWYEIYQSLILMLFNVGFIGCVQGGKGKPTYSHEDPDLLQSTLTLSRVSSFCVHPCFRAALDIDTP